MKTRPSITVTARMLSVAIAASLLFPSCAEVGPKKPSDIPWNQQEPWEGSARYGNFPQSR